MYAAGTWTMAKEHSRTLQATQRRMLRMVLGAGRRRQQRDFERVPTATGDEVADDESDHDVDSNATVLSAEQILTSVDDAIEPWVEWIRRTTHKIEELARSVKVESWVVRARSAKWRLAHRVANQHPDRWTHRVLNWNPEVSFDGLICRARRRQSRPSLRWLDDIHQFMQQFHEGRPWQSLACDARTWEDNHDKYCSDDWR